MTEQEGRRPSQKWTKDCAEEQARLIKRTEELGAETSASDVAERRFSQAEHDVIRGRISQHLLDLADFRRRCLDTLPGDLVTSNADRVCDLVMPTSLVCPVCRSEDVEIIAATPAIRLRKCGQCETGHG